MTRRFSLHHCLILLLLCVSPALFTLGPVSLLKSPELGQTCPGSPIQPTPEILHPLLSRPMSPTRQSRENPLIHPRITSRLRSRITSSRHRIESLVDVTIL